MKYRTNKAETKWPEDKAPNNTPKPIPSKTELPEAPGPRLSKKLPGQTAEGRRRSKYNAVLHGIFAQVVLTGRESEREYRGLLRALREDRRPEGALEELLVEKLAMYFWRQRRLIEAEQAEILKEMHSVRSDNQAMQADELKRVYTSGAPMTGGLMYYDRNPLVIRLCMEILKSWRDGLAENGLDFEYDMEILGQIYGYENLKIGREGLPFAYCILTLLLERDGKTKDGRLSVKEARKAILREIDTEIKRLARLEEQITKQQEERLAWKVQTRLVPVSPERSEQLIRYEAMLNRGTEKTLNQLEHQQRLRRGERISPPVQLDVSLKEDL